MTTHDVIIIGGGHNGLTAATLLATEGKKVLLLERRDFVGGVAAQEEFHKGYRTAGLLHDTSTVRAGIIEQLKLRTHGLVVSEHRSPVTLLSDDGRAVTISDDPVTSAQNIASISQKDADAYRDYRKFIDSVRPLIRNLVSSQPPDIRKLGFSDLKKLLGAGVGLRRLGKDLMHELLKVLPMSVADFLNERFETDFIKAGICFPGVFSSYNGPWSSYTTLNLLIWEATANVHMEGGPAALIHALRKGAEEAGVEMRTGAGVDRILLDESGRAVGVKATGGESFRSRIVASAIPPKATFLNLLSSEQIGPALEAEIIRFRDRGTVASLRLALNRPIRWKCEPEQPIRFARTGNSFDQMEQAFDAVKYRRFSDRPVLDIHVPTVATPGLAPEGHEVVTILSHFAPYAPDGGWTDPLRNKLRDTIVAALSDQTVDLESSIVASELLTPADLEERYGLTGGQLFHGEHAIDQLIGRPVPACATYSTPTPGLYLCGSGSYPGGGITGAPGMLAAEVIAREIL